MQTAPLRGLDQRVKDSREQMQHFYSKRVPPNYSSIDRRIGELGVSSGVRLGRVILAGRAGHGPHGDLADAGITGSYPQIDALCGWAGAR